MKNSNIVILKFGGTSMGSAATIKECVEIIKEKIEKNQKPFIVVSAISKMTDTLLNLLNLAKHKKKKELLKIFNLLLLRHLEILHEITQNKELTKQYENIINIKFHSLFEILNGILLTSDYSEKIQANILSYGEDLSSDLMELSFLEAGLNGKKINSKYFVKTNGNYLSADVDFLKTKRSFRKILNEIQDTRIFIMTGFFGGNSNNEVMLLGRGGSDFSGSIAGISLEASLIEIWTDANGIMSSDPKIIKDAKCWTRINKDVASEMARAGAKILHPKTISASHYNIDILIKNLFNRNSNGTLVNSEHYEDGVIGIVSDDDYSILHLENQDMFGGTGFIAEIGIIASQNNIPLDMATTSETTVSFTIKTNFLNNIALKLFNSIANFHIINDVVKISIIGENIINNDILDLTFSTLKKVNITPLMLSIGLSKNNIGIIVSKNDKDSSLLALHEVLI